MKRKECTQVVYVARMHYMKDDYKRISSNSKILGVFNNPDAALKCVSHEMLRDIQNYFEYCDDDDAVKVLEETFGEKKNEDNEIVEFTEHFTRKYMMKRLMELFPTWQERYSKVCELFDISQGEPEFQADAGTFYYVEDCMVLDDFPPEGPKEAWEKEVEELLKDYKDGELIDKLVKD